MEAISIITILISISSLFATFYIGRKNKEANGIQAINIVTQLQIEISKKQVELSHIETSSTSKEKFDFLTNDYLNMIELLCVYILSGFLNQNLMKVLYKDLIEQTVEHYKEEKFGVASPYKNIKEVNKLWSKDKVMGK